MIELINAKEINCETAEIHIASKEQEKPGHPARVLKEENFAIKDLIKGTILPKVKAYAENKVGPIRVSLIQDINLLLDIEKHYSKKENILFPYLEEYGILASPEDMRDVDNEIRKELKEFKALLLVDDIILSNLELDVTTLTTKIQTMISKEENILLPKLLDALTEEQWFKIAEDSKKIGYSIISPTEKWIPSSIKFE